MSLPAYADYKCSGIKWLGNVPRHWPIYALKRAVDGCKNGLWGEEPDGENDIAVIRVADFERSFATVGLDKLTYRSITPKEKESRLIKLGDLLIEKSGGGEKTLVGCVVLFKHDFEAVTSNFVARMRPLIGFDSQFLCYAFGCLYGGRVNYPSVKQVTGIQNLDAESYLQEFFCFPTPSEQTQIARFLDHETARIDTLIEEQQRLVELLKEKRQAVISHAVTKGLDPTVPMKDSGVEWLGEVPAHWTVTKLKFVTDQVVDCPHETPIYDPDGDYLVIRTADIDQGVLKPDRMYRLDREQYTHRTRRMILGKNDVVYSREGERWGHAALIPKADLYALGQRMMQLRVCDGICPEFFMYQLNSVATYRQGEVDTVGATAPHVNISTVINYCLMRPGVSEQRKIARYLNKILGGLDCLLGESLEMKGLLQERRSALISAAVTGKIDVRSWQPPDWKQTPVQEFEEVL
ncbi:restriction endonuclease subunit S [Halopseudomonas pelagia]|uniref:Restriction endonuclease subunit S n=1 Tax=Halopseudomonas pelagia TaxID=553151 RepID=A0AA91TYK9_9GAMM|nr:restriction endonuclease subunit S [Halopseudomonas pelagia]PCC97330.1 restriction endonuclease subunit S [Halopseudomonas pelagia]QFY58512.1 restriction endonuclease subunit S [Halopseudomonas pelagia]